MSVVSQEEFAQLRPDSSKPIATPAKKTPAKTPKKAAAAAEDDDDEDDDEKKAS